MTSQPREQGLYIRSVRDDDAPELATLVNQIIARGGTTALQKPFTPAALAQALLTGPEVICCSVAQGEDGMLLGFQTLLSSTALPAGVGDIGTFARAGGTHKGIGTRLFARTCDAARALGLKAINATIRADNAGGLAFYSRMGFVDHDVTRAVPLDDGTVVDRINKRFPLY